MRHREFYISVDIEADGPLPGEYSLSSIGACLAGTYGPGDRNLQYRPIDPVDRSVYPITKSTNAFYAELQPISDKVDPESAAVAGLDRRRLQEHGAPPLRALTALQDWLRTVCGPDGRAIFVSFGTFDWLYMAWYLTKYLGANPFGFNSLDLKSYYMGKERTPWLFTSKANLKRKYKEGVRHTHHGLDDALEQALIFQRIWTMPR